MRDRANPAYVSMLFRDASNNRSSSFKRGRNALEPIFKQMYGTSNLSFKIKLKIGCINFKNKIIERLEVV